MTTVMQRRVGNVDRFWHDEKGAGFAAKDYIKRVKDTAYLIWGVNNDTHELIDTTFDYHVDVKMNH